MNKDKLYRQSIQEAVDKINPGEELEIDADGLARALTPSECNQSM